jgi:hypothetical protein
MHRSLGMLRSPSNLEVVPEIEVLCQTVCFRTLPFLSPLVFKSPAKIAALLSETTVNESSAQLFSGIFVFVIEPTVVPYVVFDVVWTIRVAADLFQSDFIDDDFFTTLPTFTALFSVASPVLFPHSGSRDSAPLLALLSHFLSQPQAELLLLWLINSVHSRVGTTLIGLFSLSFCRAKNESVQLFQTILQNILPALSFVSLSSENVNNVPLQPSFQDESSIPSPVAVWPGTRIVIDETEFAEDSITELGIKNIEILTSLITSQTIDYAYEGGFQTVLTNSPVFILSHNHTVESEPSAHLITLNAASRISNFFLKLMRSTQT